MKKFLSQLVILISVVFILISINAFAKETDCGLVKVQVVFQAQDDAELACEGIRRAIRFFASYGYDDFRHVHVRVLDQVVWESVNAYDGEKEKRVVYACFDNISGCSKITSWETDYVQQREVFGTLPVTREYHSSIVAHEVAHDLYHHVLESMGKKIERPMTEFVSYVVQIETMKEPEKVEVLKLWPKTVHRSELAINSFTWAFNPHKFGIMSYRYFLENPSFMASVLAGEVDSGDKAIPNY